MAKFIYSTLTDSVKYTIYRKANAQDKMPTLIKEKEILVKGGANIARPQTAGIGVFTAKGIVTEISEEDYIELEQNKIFQLHLEKGHLKVFDKEIPLEKGIKDLENRDGAAPKTPKDYPKDKQPTTGKPSDK